ncbi:stalk domain-containing protein [Bacillus salipaludis]|uniref:stalk domain-containing protein n=1 Tax=Bacillus salipaludis TaxID=2547811 RepID=UPI002E1C26AC|nr:stalk domain-containing protein [Bacillus salipaludis]
MKKKLIAGALVLALAFSFGLGVMASPKLSFYFNGKSKNMDVKIINKKAYVPLNDFTAMFGGKVSYDKAKNKYSVTSKNYNLAKSYNAYKKVLLNEVSFFSVHDKKYVYLNKLNAPSKVLNYTVLDMDGDKLPELIIQLSYANDYPYPDSVEVLHYSNGKVYGFNYSYRGLMGLKTDGTFSWSAGAGDNGYSKLRYTSGIYKVDNLGYRQLGYDTKGNPKESYFINNKPVSEASYSTFSKKQNGKKGVVWYNITQQNIEKQLSIP